MQTLIIIFFFVSTSLLGQIGTSTRNRWFIDIPTFKQDSATILKDGYTKINIYELYLNDSSTYDKRLCRTWAIKNSGGQILSTPSPTTENIFNTITKQVYKNDKLIETVGSKCEKYMLTHTFNQSRQIIKTENKCIDCKCESRYAFDWVVYKYTNGLLTEALYFTKENLKTINLPSTKYVFEYAK